MMTKARIICERALLATWQCEDPNDPYLFLPCVPLEYAVVGLSGTPRPLLQEPAQLCKMLAEPASMARRQPQRIRLS
jgi:hypothetical protein